MERIGKHDPGLNGERSAAAQQTSRFARQLMEQLDDNLLFRWFAGLGVDDAVMAGSAFDLTFIDEQNAMRRRCWRFT